MTRDQIATEILKALISRCSPAGSGDADPCDQSMIRPLCDVAVKYTDRLRERLDLVYAETPK